MQAAPFLEPCGEGPYIPPLVQRVRCCPQSLEQQRAEFSDALFPKPLVLSTGSLAGPIHILLSTKKTKQQPVFYSVELTANKRDVGVNQFTNNVAEKHIIHAN